MSQLQQHRPGSACAEFETLLVGDKQREVLQRCAKEEQHERGEMSNPDNNLDGVRKNRGAAVGSRK